MKKITLISLMLYISYVNYAQVLPANRSVDWKIVGYKGIIPNYSTLININNFGGDDTGLTSNTAALTNAVNSLTGNSGIIYFPEGTYLFNSPITLPSGIIIRGVSSDSTILKFNLGGGSSTDAITINGSLTTTHVNLSSKASKDSTFINVVSATNFLPGDYIKLSFNDSSIISSSWAYGTVGQIAQIAGITGNKIFLESPLRLNYDLSKHPKITKLTMVQGVGIECVKIQRMDATTNQTSNINYNYTAQCWIKGVESDKCNFAHIGLNNSTNIKIYDSYFHDAHAYGGGGQGYGIACQATSGECLIENNIFKHLRHSMLLQSGANGNVFGFNYSITPFWTDVSLPSNASGDVVLHGNYPYANLFEGNICQNIVIDDSHGINGPFNTFFRNRAELYGIFMNSAPASNDQNFIGNEVTNTGFFLGLYNLSGTGHFQYANNVKGVINPSGTSTLADQSYYNNSQPPFLKGLSTWPSIGPANSINTGTIPSKQRYLLNNFTICNSQIATALNKNNVSDEISIYPNPSNGKFKIQLKNNIGITKFVVYDMIGNSINDFFSNEKNEQMLDLSGYKKGIYFIHPVCINKNVSPIKIILQ